MNKTYECFTTRYNEIYLCSENGRQIAKFADCPEAIKELHDCAEAANGI